MTQTRLQTLTRAELLDELRLFGHPLESSELDALIASDLVPFLDGDDGDVFPLFTLVQVVDAAGGGHGGTMDELRARARIFADAIDGVADGLSEAVRALRRILTTRAVLGELHRMLPVLEHAALESLRGDARFEWRMRMCLGELQELLQQDSVRDDEPTPIMAHKVAGAREAAIQRGARRPRVTARSGAAIIPGLLPQPSRGLVAPGAEPYWPNGEPTADPEVNDSSAQPATVRMPFLAERAEESPTGSPLKSSTAPFPSVPDAEEAQEVTEPFVSGNLRPRHGVTDSPGWDVKPSWDEEDESETGLEEPLATAASAPTLSVPNVVDEPLNRLMLRPTPLSSVAMQMQPEIELPRSSSHRELREKELDTAPGAADTSAVEIVSGLDRPSRTTTIVGEPGPQSTVGPRTQEEQAVPSDGGRTARNRDRPEDRPTPRSGVPEAATAANELVRTPEASAEQASTEQASTEQASTEQASTEQASTEQASTEQASTEQASTEQASTEQASTEQASTEQASTEQASAEQASAEDATTELGSPEDVEAQELLASFDALFDSGPDDEEDQGAALNRSQGDGVSQSGEGGTADSSEERNGFELRVAPTGEFPSVDLRPKRMAKGRPREVNITKEVEALAPATAAAKARVEAIARSRTQEDSVEKPREEAISNSAMIGRVPGTPASGLGSAGVSPHHSTQGDRVRSDSSAGHTVRLAPIIVSGSLSPISPARAHALDSMSEFLDESFPAPPTGVSKPVGRKEQTDLHMATRSGPGRSGRLSRHTDLLVETAGLRSTSGKSASDSRVELPLRRRDVATTVDINAVLADPYAAFERSAARLVVNGDDSHAQDELIAIVGGNDRTLARKAWAAVAPILRDRRARTDVLFGGLVMMAARDPDPSFRVRHLREAAGVAESVLGDHKQALELLTDAIALSPNEERLQDSATTIAEAFGWWPEYVDRIEHSAITSGDADVRVTLTKVAGRATRTKLNDVQRVITLYEGLVSDGIYNEDIVAELVDLYARDGRGSDTLVLLLRCAEIADGEERVGRLTRAADLCVEELNDLDGALGIYESALAKGDTSSEVRARYLGLARRSGQGARAVSQLSVHVEDPFANAMLRADIARDDFQDQELEIDARAEAFAVSGGQEKLRAGFALADALRKSGRHGDEVRTLEDMLADVGPGDRRVSVVRRLAGVLAAQEGGKDQAIEHYTESIRAGEFDEKLVHAVGSLLRADGKFEDLIEILSLAAQKSGEGEARLGYYRHVARVAAEFIEDDEQALNLIEQTVDASSGDAYVLLEMAKRSRRSGDDLSEMAALEQAVHADEVAVDPSVLMRLAELELARPRGAARAAELVGRVLDLEPLSSEVAKEVSRILPVVVMEAGRKDLDLRWSWLQTEDVLAPEQAYVLWMHLVSLQEELGDEIEKRQLAVESAMGAAADAGVDASNMASLQLSAARVKRAMGHWNSAVEHAREAAQYYLAIDPAAKQTLEAVATVAELTQYVMDERPALRLLSEAADTGVPSLMAAYAEALMDKSRWHDAMPILEKLVDGTSDPEMLERLRGELARARQEVIV